MKRNLLSLAIGAAIALPSVAAMAEPTAYGRADVSFGMYDYDDFEGGWELRSNASRLGFKGDSDIGNGLTAVYKMEFEIDMTDESKSSEDFIKSRNQYVGLATESAGEFLLGRIDTPLKQAQGKVDLFGDHAADIKVLMVGENRANNTLAYVSPKLADAVTIKVSLFPGEDTAVLEGSTAAETADNGIFDALSFSVAFEQDGLYAALAFDSEVDGKETGGEVGPDVGNLSTGTIKMDVTRLVGQYKMDNFVIGGIYQMAESAEEGDDAEETALVIEGGITLENTFLKAAFGTSEDKEGGDTVLERTLLAIGVEQKFDKQTKVYGEYTKMDYDFNSGFYEPTGSALTVGVQHNF